MDNTCECYCNNSKKLNERSALDAIDKFRPLIKKLARKLKYPSAETDVICELIFLLDKMPQINNEGAYINYISKSLNNSFISLCKYNQKITSKEVPLLEQILGDSNGYDMDMSIDLKIALSKLSKRYREVIYLYFYYQYTVAEIAKKLNISKQAVSKIKMKALKQLRELCETTNTEGDAC